MTLARSLWQERLAACGLPFLQAALHFLAEKLNNSAILTSEDGPTQVQIMHLQPSPKQLLAVQLIMSLNSCVSSACQCFTKLASCSVTWAELLPPIRRPMARSQ